MSDIKETIKSYIQKEYKADGGEEILDDTPLLTSGIIDSISALQLVDFLEKEFGIEFEAHEVDQENINTLGKIVAFVEAKKSQ
jgi:D-alanine--poly(phosphoribitol) ligase subunit 2